MAPCPHQHEHQHDAEQHQGCGQAPQQEGTSLQAWIIKHIVTEAVHHEVENFLVRPPLLQLLVDALSHVAGDGRIGIADRLILALGATQRRGEVAIALLHDRVVELAHLDGGQGRQRQRRQQDQQPDIQSRHFSTSGMITRETSSGAI